MHYVIGDVHGCYDDMMALLEKIESQDAQAKFIFVGDFIDRGPKVNEVLNWCLKHISATGKYQTVRGNHEEMVLEWYPEFLKWWEEGGYAGENPEEMPDTQYDFRLRMEETDRLDPEKLQPIMNFFEKMPYNKTLKIKTVWGERVTFRVVHAFYESQSVSEEMQHYSNIWMRTECGNLETDDIIVHGHTPTITMDYQYWSPKNTKPGMISYRKNDINLDGGCVFAVDFPMYPDFLCALCLENLEEIYVGTVEQRFLQLVTRQTGLSRQILRAEHYRERFLQEDGECEFRYRILQKMGNPDCQDLSIFKEEEIPGNPKYEVGREVSFTMNGVTFIGVIKEIIPPVEETDTVCYNLLAHMSGSFMLCEHIPEADIEEN